MLKNKQIKIHIGILIVFALITHIPCVQAYKVMESNSFSVRNSVTFEYTGENETEIPNLNNLPPQTTYYYSGGGSTNTKTKNAYVETYFIQNIEPVQQLVRENDGINSEMLIVHKAAGNNQSSLTNNEYDNKENVLFADQEGGMLKDQTKEIIPINSTAKNSDQIFVLNFVYYPLNFIYSLIYSVYEKVISYCI